MVKKTGHSLRSVSTYGRKSGHWVSPYAYKKVLEERYAKIGKEFYDKFYNCSDFDIFTMTDSQISYFINGVRNCYDAHYHEDENEFYISSIQDENVKII